jgi:hypothetical protein
MGSSEHSDDPMYDSGSEFEYGDDDSDGFEFDEPAAASPVQESRKVCNQLDLLLSWHLWLGASGWLGR